MKVVNFLFVSMLVFLLSCKEKKAALGYIAASTTEFKEKLVKEPGIILDVRPKKMYPEGHIQDAISLDYGNDNFKTELEKLDKSKPVYVYCNAGHRSRKTAVLLDKMGFEKVVELQKGLDDWKVHNYEVVTERSAQKVIELASAEAFKEKINGKEVQLIDIRTPKEYNDGHLINALNINFYDDNFIEQMNKLNKDKAVYMYCRTGRRTGLAAKKLKKEGFKKIVDLKDGITAWKDKEYPVQTEK